MSYYKPTDDSIVGLNNLRPYRDAVLSFDARFLRYAGHSSVFMNSSQILNWIDSVSTRYLQDWYEACLTLPQNVHLIKQATSNIGMFINATMDECSSQHHRAALDGKIVRCPCAAVLQAKMSRSLRFEEYTTVTACLVARHGIREGPFAECEELGWHFTAVLPLATILVNLEEESGGGYFATLFSKAQVAALERRLEGLAVEAANCKD